MKNKRNKHFLHLFAVLLVGCFLFTGCSVAKKPVSLGEQARQAVGKVIEWKRQGTDAVIKDSYINQAATSAGDWFVFAMARLGEKEDYQAYYKQMEAEVVRRYQENGGLDPVKATEWHRIGLTMLALGKDPTYVDGINLVADGTYNRGKTMDLDAQGLNGYIWALLLLDAGSYEVPKNAYETREEIKEEILLAQEPSGAWGLMKGRESIDLTAMALTALAPYKEEVGAAWAIEKGLAFLSREQMESGGFEESENENCESASQVLVALCSLGIDPEQDVRFKKKGNTVITSLLSYQQPDGGFAHTKAEEDSNTIASEQACYALAAYIKFVDGSGRLYELDKSL